MDWMMKRRVGSLGVFLALCVAGPALAAEETGWQMKLTGVSAQSTGGEGFNSSLGYGLGLEYRATPRIGVGLHAVSSRIDDELGFDFFGAQLSFRSRFRMTPVLGRLDFHLTPGHRVDLIVGPVAGWVRYGDFEMRVSGPDGSVQVARTPIQDGFAWGAHLGFDVPMGERGLLFTAGATYLKAKFEPKIASADSGAGTFDLDPLLLQVGLGYRF
jgi:opacity protein-like surface antigen